MSLYAVVDPKSGEVVREYPTATDEQIEQALAAAAKAYREWSKTSTLADRVALIRRVAALHTERREKLAEIIHREMGKPLDQALGEVDFSAAIYEYYADNAEKFLADEPIQLLDGDGSAVIKRGPVGVLLGIMPWNYPLLPGRPFRGTEPDVGQHDRAQARPAMPGVPPRPSSRSSTTPATPPVPTSTCMRPTSRSPTPSPTRGCRVSR